MIICLISLTALVAGSVYFWLVRFFIKHWKNLPTRKIPDDFQPRTAVTVVVSARNEASRIADCIDSLLRQKFPLDLLEILVVDDHSTDHTAALIRDYGHPHLQLISLPKKESGKKAALTHGIGQATGTLILTTDADCVLPPTWISQMVAYYQSEEVAFITGPVELSAGPSLLQRFQALDFLGTMLITGAGIHSATVHMSNGANLAYPRAVFEAVGGFSGIDHLASGDDMLLMHKIQRQHPGNIGFLKAPGALVRTPAVAGWRDFVQQRLRWATKNGTYQEKRIVAVLALVFFLCWGIILSPLLVLVYGWPGILPFLIMVVLKSLADHQLLDRATTYFNRSELMKYFWPSQAMHIFYIAGIGLLANLTKRYRWKDRNVS